MRELKPKKNISGILKLNWGAPYPLERTYVATGNVSIEFENVVSGARLVVVFEVDESAPGGTVKINFPTDTWTERGTSFNVQPGYMVYFEFIAVDNAVLLINSKQVS